MDGLLSRVDLIAAARMPRKFKDVPIPELGGRRIRVQGMSALERGRYEAQFTDRKTGKTRMELVAQARELLAIECCVDDAGNKLLTGADVKALNDVDAAILDRIADAARELAGIGQDDYEELLGNSEPTRCDVSPARSPSGSETPTSTPSSTASAGDN